MYRIYSFDIFDTLIARDLARSRDVFSLVQLAASQDLNFDHSNELVENFPTLRMWAQEHASAQLGREEITLQDIYQTLAQAYGDQHQVSLDTLMSLEIQLEIQHSYPIKENIERLHQLLDEGKRVILISDMYLARETIIEMLKKVSKRVAKLPLYLSSEVGLTKRSGRLFHHVFASESIQPSQLTHVGDNLFSDFLNPRTSGSTAELYSESELTEAERAYCNDANGLTASVIAGASKRARLEHPNQSDHHKLGASLTGPLLFGFANNLIKQAQDRELDTLYFIARDGFLIREIAQRIIDSRGLDLNCSYLYVSRQSIYLAATYSVSASTLAWAFKGSPTLSQICSRLQLAPHTLFDYYKGERNLEQALSPTQIASVTDVILREPKLRDSILEAAEIARKAAWAYLKQEIKISQNDTFAVVDLGWQGSIQDALYRILKNELQVSSVIGFYYGCLKFNLHTQRQNQKLAYQMSPSSRPGIAPILECLTTASHGTTLSYIQNEAGRWEPVLKQTDARNEIYQDFEDYKDGILEFTDNVCNAYAEHPDLPFYYAGIDNHILEKLTDGLQLAADVIGKQQYDGSLEDGQLRELAPPFTPWTAIRYLFCNRKQQNYTQWYRASYLRSSKLTQIILSLDPHSYIGSVYKAHIHPQQLKQQYIRWKFMLSSIFQRSHKK